MNKIIKMQKREQLELTLKKNSRENEQAAQAIEKGGCPRVAITSKYLRIQRILEPIQFFSSSQLRSKRERRMGQRHKMQKKGMFKTLQKNCLLFFLQQLRNSKGYAISTWGTWGNYFPTCLKKLNYSPNNHKMLNVFSLHI